ncbi:hypothetical protein EYF80_024159 [Liparis tanakae]|uniref:Uncharacterized protein n=1 Tax=Liparis tanakae TaxID=230148 RepID=A0A4Z2HJ86_9TELE|nr:hypothetical protein EYF80_024159 [Liparis tanakae]
MSSKHSVEPPQLSGDTRRPHRHSVFYSESLFLRRARRRPPGFANGSGQSHIEGRVHKPYVNNTVPLTFILRTANPPLIIQRSYYLFSSPTSVYRPTESEQSCTARTSDSQHDAQIDEAAFPRNADDITAVS